MKITAKDINKKQKSIEILIEGELTLQNAEIAKNKFVELLSKHKIFKVKLQNIDTLDLAFIQLLISFFDTIINEKKKLSIEKTLSPDIEKILQSSGIIKFIEKYIES